jgi:hypothetical protein
MPMFETHETVAVEFRPDPTGYFSVCGQTPVVTAIDRDGTNHLEDGPCGPCFFGSAEMLDPAHWSAAPKVFCLPAAAEPLT